MLTFKLLDEDHPQQGAALSDDEGTVITIKPASVGFIIECLGQYADELIMNQQQEDK